MKRIPIDIPRRTVLAGGLATATGIAIGTTAHANAVKSGGSPEYVHRAQASYAALQRYFYDPATSFYRQQYPYSSGNPWSYIWPFSQAMIATQAMVGLPVVGKRYDADVVDRYTALSAYWNTEITPSAYDSYLRPPYGQGGAVFYDDNEWIALGFLQRHTMAAGGDRAALARAAQIFDLAVHGWDTNPDHPNPGGVFWTQGTLNKNRNTVSNAPAAEVGVRLYLATGNTYYLEWATRMYDWVRTNMLAPNGLYWDHVDLAGVIEKTQWSYNQGVMIGAGALLYRATGTQKYLAEARDTANAALDFYAENERYFTQTPVFHAIFFANLLQLSVLVPDPAYRKAMQWYADEAYDRFRDPATGLYRFDGAAAVPLLKHAGMVRIEAMLGWLRPAYAKLT